MLLISLGFARAGVIDNETVWLPQQQIAELFQTTVPNISMHIKNIFEESELTPEATIKGFLIVRQEGSRNDRDILTHAGTISHEIARELAEAEYEKFSRLRITDESNQESDFDTLIKKLPPTSKH